MRPLATVPVAASTPLTTGWLRQPARSGPGRVNGWGWLSAEGVIGVSR
jgi:hypothetical protein